VGLVLLLVSTLRATGPATVNTRVVLRSAPTTDSEPLGSLLTGTRVKVLGENGAWRQVLSPDGRTGFVMGMHLTEGEPVTPPSTAQKPEVPPAPPPRTVSDEVKDLRAEVAALRERPEPATPSDIERLQARIEEMLGAQRELLRSSESRSATAPADPSLEGMLGLAPVLLVVGGLIGWTAGRFVQHRKDRRIHNRLRL
jgi:hypothetical protein